MLTSNIVITLPIVIVKTLLTGCIFTLKTPISSYQLISTGLIFVLVEPSMVVQRKLIWRHRVFSNRLNRLRSPTRRCCSRGLSNDSGADKRAAV
jgi:hypothetical protein